MTTTDNQLGQATPGHSFTKDVKLPVSGRYYDGSIREFGSFIDPDIMSADPAIPTVHPIIPSTMITDTREATFDANLLVKAQLLGGSHVFLAGSDYDWTPFFSNMGLFVSDTPDGAIDLAKPNHDAIYKPQLPVNSLETDHYRTPAFYVQDQAAYDRLRLTGRLRYTQLDFEKVSNIGVANKNMYRVSPSIGATFDVTPALRSLQVMRPRFARRSASSA